MPTNCWTFQAPYGTSHMEMRAALLTTYDARRQKQDTYHVSVQTGHFGWRVRIADKKIIQQMPGSLGWIFEADLTEADNTTLPGEASYELTPTRTGATHTLILIKSEVSVLSYKNQSRPHFIETNAWIGADGPGLMIQAGDHQSPFKKQLFRLEPGGSILFIDSNKEVTRIIAGNFSDEPTTLRATAGEVADYVLGEAEKRGKNSPTSRAWCYHALQELGCQHQIDEFARMFPGFRRK